jgi:peptidoglycan-associated lipoprotein
MYRLSFLFFMAALISISACTYTQKIKDGKTAYERMQYSVATKMLTKEYNKAKSRLEKGKIAYLLGDSYRRMNKNEASIEWFKSAYDNQYGIDALKYYAFALKQN